jgi:MoxR-like ATPase
MSTIRPKFEQLETELNDELIERRQEIYGALLALVSRSSMFFLGKPGIAKSFLVDRIMKRVAGAEYFPILMSRFTQPEELFGPPSLAALEAGRFEHLIDGYLPTAHVAFLDEIWKGSNACLNILLTAVNERKYKHGASMLDIPLATIFTASNELPADDSLNAIYDRMLLRYEVDGVRDQSSFMRMLELDVNPAPAPVLSWAEIEVAQAEARAVKVPERAITAMAELKRKLEGENIELSDRRYVQALRVVRAAAWFDDCSVADTDHLAPLEHVLWHSPEQRSTVSRIVLELANPLEIEAADLLASIRDLDKQIDDISNDDERMRLGNEVHQKLSRAADELKSLQERAGEGQRRSMKVREVKDKLAQVTERVLIEVFNFSPEDAKNVKKD